MNEQGYTRTWQQCQRRNKSLKLIYRKVKDNNNNRSGRARVTCPFFEECDGASRDKPSFVTGDGETDSEVELLLRVTQEYKVAKASENVDWETCQNKYGEILDCFKEQYPTDDVDYPHSKDEPPLIVALKQATNNRSSTISDESYPPSVSRDCPSPLLCSSAPSPATASEDSDGMSTETQNRRDRLNATLSSYRQERLKRKLSNEGQLITLAQEDLKLRRQTFERMEAANRVFREHWQIDIKH
ncbi:adhesion G-protein coupled receptor G7-like [Tachysurus ichikawai]